MSGRDEGAPALVGEATAQSIAAQARNPRIATLTAALLMRHGYCETRILASRSNPEPDGDLLEAHATPDKAGRRQTLH